MNATLQTLQQNFSMKMGHDFRLDQTLEKH